MEQGDAFREALDRLGPPLLQTLHAIEQAMRHLHPPALPQIRAALEPLATPLGDATARFLEIDPAGEIADLHAQFLEGAELASRALGGLLAPPSPTEGIAAVLRAMRDHADAQAVLYPLAPLLVPVSRYFLEGAYWDREHERGFPRSESRVGLHQAHNGPDERGGFHFYVPEWHDGKTPLPLVVALHGGSGHGRSFLWTWLREARSRGFALLSPTSRGTTWSLMGPDVDSGPLQGMIDWVSERWPIDRGRILLTGLSDGGTFSLLTGLRADAPYTAIAPIAGVLHPNLFANGGMEQAAGRRIYLVHGALDWMFPVSLAQGAAEELRKAGADLTYREIPDLSHTYPRDENDALLRWFDPTLALPESAEANAPPSG
ncbi:MAG: phospholipase [Myxococcota bacterium]